jgi:hypothetical protein
MAAEPDQPEEESVEEKRLRKEVAAQAAKLPSTFVDFYYESSWGDMMRIALGEQVYGHTHMYMAFTIPIHVAEELAHHILGEIQERKEKLAQK